MRRSTVLSHPFQVVFLGIIHVIITLAHDTNGMHTLYSHKKLNREDQLKGKTQHN